ncbi:hypothetical protein D3C87_1166560 [compost metagenome]
MVEGPCARAAAPALASPTLSVAISYNIRPPATLRPLVKSISAPSTVIDNTLLFNGMKSLSTRSLNRYRLDRPKARASSFTRAAFLSVCAELHPQVQLIASLMNNTKNRRSALQSTCCCAHFTAIIRKASCIFGHRRAVSRVYGNC